MKITLSYFSTVNSSNKLSETVIGYSPDVGDNSVNTRKLYQMFSDKFVETSCLGINFEKIFSASGMDIKNYYRISSYEVSKIAGKILYNKLKKYPSIKILLPSGNARDYFLEKNWEMPVYEYCNKLDKEDIVIVFNPGTEEYTLFLMKSYILYRHQFDIPSEIGIKYLTGESSYVVNKDELLDLCLSLKNNSVDDFDILHDHIKSFIPGENLAMWDWNSIEGRHPGVDWDKTPWKMELLKTKDKIKEIMESNKCYWKKSIEIKKIIK